MDQVRNRYLTNTRRGYQQWRKAESIRNLARMQLDLAREDLTVLLAKNSEGRVPMSQVEQARLDESNRWIALFDSETQVTRAKLAILKQMGTLMASLKAASSSVPVPPAQTSEPCWRRVPSLLFLTTRRILRPLLRSAIYRRSITASTPLMDFP